MKQQNGFTLIEVLIALLILGVALTAIFHALIEDSRISSHLEQKTVAHWVGLDVLTELQSTERVNPVAPITNSGTSKAFGKQWYWQIKTVDASNPYYLEVSVDVSTQKKSPVLSTLTTFVSKRHE